MQWYWYVIVWLYVFGLVAADMAYGRDVISGIPTAGQRLARVAVVAAWPVFLPIVLVLGSLGIIKPE